jgi:simple sugar transport system ATP-binding protein
MHILSGYLVPSSGTILVDGKERRFSAPADALALGIGMVRQHPHFIQGFKTWEDCILGAEINRSPPADGPASVMRKCRSLFLDRGGARKRVLDLSAKWGFDLPLDKRAESLTVSQRQMAATLALLLRGVKWFIFDEPTAVLTPDETKSLYALFRRLRDEGRGIILITHKLEEALELSDKVTVMRNGVTQQTRDTKELTAETLRDSIFGAEDKHPAEVNTAAAESAAADSRSHHAAAEKPVLEIRDLAVEAPGFPHLRNVSLRLEGGKILGIAGVRDSGLETLELAIAGFLGKGSSGSITLNGVEIGGKGARAFRKAGGAYLGADRLGSNLAPELPLKESLIIHAFRRYRRGIFLDSARLNSWCEKIMKSAGIARSVSDRASSFSGGMLQRILLAREFAEDASLVVLAEAGSGLDQLNIGKLAEDLRAFVRHGAAALLFSTDVEELLPLTDEVMILRNGTLANERAR